MPCAVTVTLLPKPGKPLTPPILTLEVSLMVTSPVELKIRSEAFVFVMVIPPDPAYAPTICACRLLAVIDEPAATAFKKIVEGLVVGVLEIFASNVWLRLIFPVLETNRMLVAEIFLPDASL